MTPTVFTLAARAAPPDRPTARWAVAVALTTAVFTAGPAGAVVGWCVGTVLKLPFGSVLLAAGVGGTAAFGLTCMVVERLGLQRR